MGIVGLVSLEALAALFVLRSEPLIPNEKK
jgi:hypothetical protein